MFESEESQRVSVRGSAAYGNVEERGQHEYLRTWSVECISGSRRVFKTAKDGTASYARSYLELAAHIVDDSLWICSSPVQLVDERYPRHGISFHLAVDSKGLRLHPGHTAKN